MARPALGRRPAPAILVVGVGRKRTAGWSGRWVAVGWFRSWDRLLVGGGLLADGQEAAGGPAGEGVRLVRWWRRRLVDPVALPEEERCLVGKSTLRPEVVRRN